MQMISTISVDSLKVRIPLSDVTILDKSLFGEKHLVDAYSGEVEKEFKQNRYKVQSNGITTSFGIESQITASQKVKEYFVILLNSKILQDRYFEGLCMDTIETAYLRIQSLGVAKFSYDAFLDAEGTDVDIKQDEVNSSFDDTLKILHLHAKPSKVLGMGCNVFSKPTNKGIEFCKRETASPSVPFLKFYHKGLELINGSKLFYSKYLVDLDIDVSNLVRVETTVKNKKHFRRFGVNDTSLRSIMSLKQDKLKEILKHSIETHLEKRMPNTEINDNGLKPADRVYFNTISILIQRGMNYNLIRESLVQGIDNASSKTLTRKKLDSIYNSYIKGSKGDSIANAMSNFFKSVGWA